MPPSHAELDDLQQVYALNRLFLNHLKDRAEQGCDCLGLPKRVITILKRSDPSQLDQIAEFPRALFNFKVTETPAAPELAPDDAAHGRARQAVQLTILITLWNFCHRSAYSAQAFFGLTAEVVGLLRNTALSDLPELGAHAQALRCAFASQEWLWEKLLTETDSRVRRELVLIALQPISATRHTLRQRSLPQLA